MTILLVTTLCTFQSIVLLSLMFCTIGVAGLVGNLLVVIAIVANKKMRHSATNLFIITMVTATVPYQPLHYEPGCRRLDHHAVRSAGDCSVHAQSRLVARTRALQVTAIYPRLVSVRFHLDTDGGLH